MCNTYLTKLRRYIHGLFRHKDYSSPISAICLSIILIRELKFNDFLSQENVTYATILLKVSKVLWPVDDFLSSK